MTSTVAGEAVGDAVGVVAVAAAARDVHWLTGVHVLGETGPPRPEQTERLLQGAAGDMRAGGLLGQIVEIIVILGGSIFFLKQGNNH